MQMGPPNLLEYQPRHRQAAETKLWRSIVFYALGALGLAVVGGAFALIASFFGERLGMW